MGKIYILKRSCDGNQFYNKYAFILFRIFTRNNQMKKAVAFSGYVLRGDTAMGVMVFVCKCDLL